MDKFSYFHLCDHRLKKENEYELKGMTVFSNGASINTVINGAILIDILKVQVLEYDRETDIDYSVFFKEGESISEPLPTDLYEPTLHNRIKWMVTPPKKYLVTGNVKFTNKTEETFRGLDCPICGGKGWFIDILNKDRKFMSVKGIEKIAQRIIKDFMTEIGTQYFDRQYGTKVKSSVTRNSVDDERLFNEIRMILSDVEDRYLTEQQGRILDLNSDEILQSLVVENIFRSTKNPTVVLMQLKLRTMVEEQLFQLGF